MQRKMKLKSAQLTGHPGASIAFSREVLCKVSVVQSWPLGLCGPWTATRCATATHGSCATEVRCKAQKPHALYRGTAKISIIHELAALTQVSGHLLKPLTWSVVSRMNQLELVMCRLAVSWFLITAISQAWVWPLLIGTLLYVQSTTLTIAFLL